MNKCLFFLIFIGLFPFFGKGKVNKNLWAHIVDNLTYARIQNISLKETTDNQNKSVAVILNIDSNQPLELDPNLPNVDPSPDFNPDPRYDPDPRINDPRF